MYQPVDKISLIVSYYTITRFQTISDNIFSYTKTANTIPVHVVWLEYISSWKLYYFFDWSTMLVGIGVNAV